VEFAERLLSTRRGALLIALGAAVLAGIILLVYVRHYRHNVTATAATTPVLVARSLIQKGTPGNIVGTQHLYEISQVPQSAVLPGAYVDPSVLGTAVAVTDVYPGQQLTSADFAPIANVLDTEISGTQRALTFPIDSTRTLGGQLVSGDRIDIYINLGGSVRELLQNVPVLVGPGGGTVTVQLNAKTAGLLALAVDSGKIWFTLRPRTGVPKQPNVVVTPLDLVSGK
jgi:pilus assembly protein CpaB